MPRIVLASASSTRQQLLRNAGVPFTIRVPAVDEEAITGETPLLTAALRASAKAHAAHPSADELVIAADQVLDFQGEPLGKMPNEEAAEALLTRLSGQTHTLHSAVTLLGPHASWSESFVVSTHLTMRTLSQEDISVYLAANEWQGCAGGYRIEGRGVLLFSKIEGCYFNILGLPMTQLVTTLATRGIHLLS